MKEMSTNTINFVHTLYLLANSYKQYTSKIGNLLIALGHFQFDRSIIGYLNLKYVKIIFIIFSIIQKKKCILTSHSEIYIAIANIIF